MTARKRLDLRSTDNPGKAAPGRKGLFVNTLGALNQVDEEGVSTSVVPEQAFPVVHLSGTDVANDVSYVIIMEAFQEQHNILPDALMEGQTLMVKHRDTGTLSCTVWILTFSAINLKGFLLNTGATATFQIPFG